MRNCQDKQSLGIPIGPISSWIVAECVLADLDKKIKLDLEENNIAFAGFRILDDYELVFQDETSLKKAKSIIVRHFDSFRLVFNMNKTRINKLPKTFIHDWAVTLMEKAESISHPSVSPPHSDYSTKVAYFFNEALKSYENLESNSVLRFAVFMFAKNPNINAMV